MNDNLLPYWMAFAHTKGFSNKRKMDFLIKVVHDQGISLDNALRAIKDGNRLNFDFKDNEWQGILTASQEIPNYSFLAEKLLEKGIHAINIMDKYVYPDVLKKNLKKDAPILIYAKGNMDLLKKNSVAIVGARNSSDTALAFTKNVAKKAVNNKFVVVSGFAKGVDKMALDAALEFRGQSIIVLPQGIDTYTSKDYYAQIVSGHVLVISTYHPKAKWSVGLAMDRNKTIYGLAQEIYAAESNDSGGTWEGVIDGLKRGRLVFVRQPEGKENNANLLLIQKGATPVDLFGNLTNTAGVPNVIENQESRLHKVKSKTNFTTTSKPKEPDTNKAALLTDKEIQNEVVEILRSYNGKGITINDLSVILNLDENTKKRLNEILSKSPVLTKEKKGKFNFFFIKETLPEQGVLFNK